MTGILDAADRRARLAELESWQEAEGGKAITRSLKCKDFTEAFALMTRIAFLAERAGHHPDWSNSYNRITISLSTHDAGGVTVADIDLAAKIDAISKGF